MTSFGSFCFGLDGTIDKHHPSSLAGAWLGKDLADHDILAVGNQRLIRCKAVRQTDQMWDKERLAGLSIGPSDLLKIATHSKMKLYPTLPPAPVPLRDEGEATADEAASDPPSPKEVGPGNAENDREKEDSGGDHEIEGMAELLENETAEEQSLKRQIAEDDAGSKVKMAKTNPTGAGDLVDKEKVKVPRFDLSGSPSASSTGGGL